MMKTLDNSIAEALRLKRESLKITRNNAAELLGASRSGYAKWESGGIRHCSEDNLRRIGYFLEGLLDSFAQGASFPLCKEDRRIIEVMFSHRELLERAAPYREIIEFYKAELAALTMEFI